MVELGQGNEREKSPDNRSQQDVLETYGHTGGWITLGGGHFFGKKGEGGHFAGQILSKPLDRP